jgi:UrcA family protein
MKTTTSRLRTSISANALAIGVIQIASMSAQAGPAVPVVTADHSPQVAAPSVQFVPGELVPYGDLNLASQIDLNTLRARVRDSVDSMCGHADVMSRRAVRAEARCRDAAFADARVHEQSLTAFWQAWNAERDRLAAL